MNRYFPPLYCFAKQVAGPHAKVLCLAVTVGPHHYEPTTDTWPRMSTVGAPIDLVEHFALWTGTQMVVIGDSHSSKGLTIGGRYTPLSLFMKP